MNPNEPMSAFQAFIIIVMTLSTLGLITTLILGTKYKVFLPLFMICATFLAISTTFSLVYPVRWKPIQVEYHILRLQDRAIIASAIGTYHITDIPTYNRLTTNAIVHFERGFNMYGMAGYSYRYTVAAP